MKKIFYLFLFFLLACGNSNQTTDNMMVKSESEKGWKLLFDGQTMKGWRTYQNKPSDSWSVKDSALYCAGHSTNKSDMRADMITTEQYENFELALEWKIAPQGNSGIMYRVTEEFEAPYLSGPEYQLIDDDNFPEKLEDWQKTGANYAMHTASINASKPPGEWNRTRILVNGAHVEHWLNDRKVVEYELWTNDWKKKKAEGKWKDAPGYGMAKKGYIALQDHGSEAWFRNIRVRSL